MRFGANGVYYVDFIMTEQEFKETVYPLKDGMYRFALAILMHREQAEDAVQNVLENLWKKFRRGVQVRNVEAFAMASVRNACCDVLRRRRPVVEPSDMRMPSVPEDQALWNVREMVSAALGRLPLKRRMIVSLKDVEGYDIREIAGFLAMTEGGVRAELSRGRRELRACITKMIDYGNKKTH